MTSKAGVAYTYTDSAHKHAVTKLNGVQKYWYDANGNQTTRIVGSNSYSLSYDAENHLVGVSGAATATFVYGPGGERVKGVVGGVTTYYVGSHYEKQGSTVRKYHYAGAQRVAMREGATLYWLLSDHLGSQAITANGTTGAKVAEVRYKAWGEDRYTTGTTPTTYRYTGQRAEASLGLYYYGARWYDAALSRFVQADTVVPSPGNPQSLNRFSYVLDAPLRFIDPTGHFTEEELATHYGFDSIKALRAWSVWQTWLKEPQWIGMLLSAEAKLGSILVAVIDGQRVEVMFCGTNAPGVGLTLWDARSHSSMGLEWFQGKANGTWRLAASGDAQELRDYQWGHSVGANASSIIDPPILPADWTQAAL